jgi:hypothetical protein
MSSVDQEIAENQRVLRLIRENDGWALSRVLRAAELEAEVERLRGALVEAKSLAVDYRDGPYYGFRGSRQQIALHIDAALDCARDKAR